MSPVARLRVSRSVRRALLIVGVLSLPLVALGLYHSPSVLTTPGSLMSACNDEGGLVREGNVVVNDHPGTSGSDAAVTAGGCAYLHIGLGDWSKCRNLPVDNPGVPCRKGLWTVTFEDFSTDATEDNRTTFTYGL